MNIFFKRSAAKQNLAALSRLVSSESFASSSVPPVKSVSRLYPPNETYLPKNYRFAAICISKFHRGTQALEFMEPDAVRAGVSLEESNEEGSLSSKNEGLEIAKLGIAKEIVSYLAKRGITKLFPIQRAVLEPAMHGRDMIGCAKTGSGKTLAFGIPIMDKIMQFNAKHGRGRNPLALVLAPTREFAKQVEKEFRESSPLDTICVYGGVPIQSQIKSLQYGVDVVVGTPSRVIDLIKRGSLNLSEIQFVVLDEADQMLAVGFDEDAEVILDKLPKKRQSMMFSVTMPSWIQRLTHEYLNDPETIDLVGENDKRLAEGITLYSTTVEKCGKASILGQLVKEHAKDGKAIIFTQTKHNADRLAYAMSKSFSCKPLHGDISQNQREKTLSGFRDGRFNTLIATDFAAHGLDMPNVDLVIHYEMPTTLEIFVHRSSRTGRAGKKGTVILIHTYEQSRAVSGLEHDAGCKFTQLPMLAIEGRDEGMFAGMSCGRMTGGGFGGGSGFGMSRGGFGNSDSRSPTALDCNNSSSAFGRCYL